MEVVCLKSYLHRHEAELHKGILKTEGIEAFILADDCGGMYPSLSLGGEGLRLMVRKEDLTIASKILEEKGEE